MIAQLFGGMIGAWLMTSVLLWDHGTIQLVNALLVGASCVALAPAIYVRPWTRWLMAGAGYWLAFSSLTVFFLTDSLLTAANHIVSGSLIFVSAIGPFSGITVIPARASVPVPTEQIEERRSIAA